MSVLNKKPYAQSVIESLTGEQLSTLASLLNGAVSTKFRSFINNSYPITNDDKGVSHCVLETKDEVFTGYLLYNNSYCVLLSYNASQEMKIVKILLSEDKYEIVNEELSISELRGMVSVSSDTQETAWEQSVSPKIAASENGIDVSGDLEATGLVKADKIEQSSPNNSFEVSVGNNTSGLTVTLRFAKMMVINNVLHAIYSYELKNETEAEIASSQIRFDCLLNDEIASKVLLMNGKMLNDATPSLGQVCHITVARGSTFGNVANTYLFAQAKNKIAGNFSSSQAIAAGASVQYFARAEIVLFQ